MKRFLLALVLLAGCSKRGPELHLLIWPDYLAEDTVRNFEKEFGCRVTVDDIESSETLRARLEGGRSGFDVVVPSDEVVPAFIRGGLLEKLDPQKLPNLKNLSARFRGPAYDPQNEYSVAYMWGTTGIAYNKEKVSPAPDSWGALWDPKHANRVTMLGDAREVFAAALWAQGVAAPLTSESVEKAKRKLLERKPLAYESSPRKMLVDGDAWISHAFNGDAIQAADAAPIGYVIPKEGGTLWIDNLAIAKGSPSPDLAHAFIDYLLRPEVSAAITNRRYFANPNDAARKFIKKEILENAWVYPSEEDLKRCALLREPSPEVKKKLDDAWAEVKGR